MKSHFDRTHTCGGKERVMTHSSPFWFKLFQEKAGQILLQPCHSARVRDELEVKEPTFKVKNKS